MAAKRRLRKVRDERSAIRCASGAGVLRQEVWVDSQGGVARYNLAFINHFLFAEDNGRVLGYDSSHGYHHRHFKGVAEPYEFVSFEETLERFLSEVAFLRKEKP